MRIDTAFDIDQRVLIVPIEQQGTVVEIKYDGVRLAYNVEYWWNGEIKGVWLYERDLKNDRTHVHASPEKEMARDSKIKDHESRATGERSTRTREPYGRPF